MAPVRPFADPAAGMAERRQAAEALRESRAELARELAGTRKLQKISSLLIEDDSGGDSLYDQILDAAMAIMDADFSSLQILDADKRVLRLLGYRNFHPDSAERWRSLAAGDVESCCGAALRQGGRVIVPDVEQAEIFLRTPEVLEPYRRSGIVAVQSTPLIARDGRPIGMMSTHWRRRHEPNEHDLALFDVLARQTADVLERRDAESALRKSEERYRTLFDSIDEGLAIVELVRDAAGNAVDLLFIDVNAVFERETGLSEVRGKLRSETGAIHEPVWLASLDRVVRTGESFRAERYTPDLGRWYRIFVSRVGGEESSQLAIVFEDISERKHRERNQELLAEVTEELVGLETIADTMERLGEKIARHFGLPWCGFVELSPDFESTVAGYGWNAPEVAPLYGPYRMRDYLSAEQLDRYLLGEAVIVSDAQNDPRVSAAGFGALGVRSFVIVPLVRERICRFQVSIMDRKVRAWRLDEIELIRELTQRMWTRLERARAEEALRRSEARLRTVAAELQEADRRKNHFLAMLGHELRNPLAAIRNGVLLLRSEKARPESRAAALPIVADQVGHMERLVDDLLDLTRVVQGSVQVRRAKMALQEALQQALEMLRPQSEAGGFEMSLDLCGEPLELLGDGVRLTQVFMNVIGNAIKYSGDSRRIEIAARREGEMAVVRIRDHGVGISAELLPRIFEPFVQATSGLTLQAGLGLGLAVVRQLVRLHDGDVETFSEGPGQGSEFVLRFPLLS